jgi:hypothetical protein
MHHNAEPFRAFSFHGPDPCELVGSMQTLLSRHETCAFSFHGPDPCELVGSMQTLLSRHETCMQVADWQEWKNEPFNFDLK